MPSYYSGLTSDLWRRYEQRRGITGRSLTPGEMSGLVDPMLAYNYQMAVASGDREQRQKELDRQYELQREQQKAAETAGYVQAAGSLGQLYLTKKYLDLYNKPTATPALTSAPTSSPSLAPTSGAGSGGVTTAGAGNYVMANQPAYSGGAATAPTPTTSYGSYGLAGEMGEGVGATAGGTGTTSTGTTASPGAGGWGTAAGATAAGIGAGLAAGYLQQTGEGQRANTFGSSLNRNLGGPNLSNEGFAAGGQGFASGAAAGGVAGGPWGALVGGVIGAVIGVGGQAVKEKRIPGVKMFGETIIPDVKTVLCTYCYERGYIGRNLYACAEAGVATYIPMEVRSGYFIIGDRIVAKAKKSRVWNWIARKIGTALARELAHMAYPKRYSGSRFGRALIKYGSPVCRAMFDAEGVYHVAF